jgi:hypothetical protein
MIGVGEPGLSTGGLYPHRNRRVSAPSGQHLGPGPWVVVATCGGDVIGMVFHEAGLSNFPGTSASCRSSAKSPSPSNGSSLSDTVADSGPPKPERVSRSHFALRPVRAEP